MIRIVFSKLENNIFILIEYLSKKNHKTDVFFLLNQHEIMTVSFLR